MKSRVVTTIRLILSFIFLQVVGCADQGTDPVTSLEQIRFSTDAPSYATSDTIRLSLENNSQSDITVGLRCGWYLEMFYQKRENEVWSDNLWFPYMSLRCVTVPKIVKMNTTFGHSLPAEMFYSTGTFRLKVTVYIERVDTSLSLVSNSFEIR